MAMEEPTSAMDVEPIKEEIAVHPAKNNTLSDSTDNTAKQQDVEETRQEENIAASNEEKDGDKQDDEEKSEAEHEPPLKKLRGLHRGESFLGVPRWLRMPSLADSSTDNESLRNLQTRLAAMGESARGLGESARGLGDSVRGSFMNLVHANPVGEERQEQNKFRENFGMTKHSANMSASFRDISEVCRRHSANLSESAQAFWKDWRRDSMVMDPETACDAIDTIEELDEKKLPETS